MINKFSPSQISHTLTALFFSAGVAAGGIFFNEAQENKDRITNQDSALEQSGFDKNKTAAILLLLAFSAACHTAKRRNMKRTLPIHEAGHSYLAQNNPNLDIEYATIKRRAFFSDFTILGHVKINDKFIDLNTTNEQRISLENEIKIALAGKLAEEIKYGSHHKPNGIETDMKSARYFASEIIKIRDKSDSKTDSLFQSIQKDLAYKIPYIKDPQVEQILTAIETETRTFLVENFDDVERIAQALIEHKTLTGEEITALLNQDVETLPFTAENSI